MQIRRFVLPCVATAVVVLGPVLGYEAAVHASPASKSRHVQRIDYTLSVVEPGKAPVTSAFVMNVEEGGHAETLAGANIPLSTGLATTQSPRQDVGVRIDCQLQRAGADLLLHTSFQLSGPDERAEPGPRSIVKVTTSGDAVVPQGKPSLVAAVEQPTSHVRYELTATATKLR